MEVSHDIMYVEEPHAPSLTLVEPARLGFHGRFTAVGTLGHCNAKLSRLVVERRARDQPAGGCGGREGGREGGGEGDRRQERKAKEAKKETEGERRLATW